MQGEDSDKAMVHGMFRQIKKIGGLGDDRH